MNQLTEETFEQTLRSFITSETIDLRDLCVRTTFYECIILRDVVKAPG